MKLTVDILEDFINSLDLSGLVTGFSYDGVNDQTKLFVEKTYHARARMFLNVDGTQHKILSVENNKSITVEGEIISPLVYEVPTPFFFHGTPLMTNANHISGAREKDKLPMVFLYEIFREKQLPQSAGLAREADLRLFFLDSANFGEWTTEDHYSKRLLGLNNLIDKFIESALNYTCCFYLFDTPFTRINHANWGTYKDNKGHEKRIFDDDLSGVELNFVLPLKKCI